MKTLLATCLIAGSFLAVSAQDPQPAGDTLWDVNGIMSLNASQLAFSPQWASGGESSLSGNALVNLAANYRNPDSTLTWANELTLGYGLIKQGEDPVRKSDDKINFASKVGYRASKYWYYSGLVSFKSQFTEGYANPGDVDRTKISNFFSPAYLNISGGMDFKPGDNFTMLLAPVTGKITFVMDDELAATGAFGVEPGNNARAEFGGYAKFAYKKEILKNVILNTKLDLFTNYLDEPQNIDVNYDLMLTFKVNEYISASFIAEFIYDHDIKFELEDGGMGPALQWKEQFGLGLTYSF